MLLPTRAVPAERASRLWAAPVTEENAAAGSEGSPVLPRATWICVMTAVAPRVREANRAAGSRTTLSGGAVGCDWLGAPTVWKRESAWGRSTTPSTFTRRRPAPGNWMAMVSPGAACRLEAVCWASRTPVEEPDSVRTASGKRAR